MVNLNNCLGCESEIKERQWCEICQILIPEITQYSLDTIPNKKKAEKIRKMLKDPEPVIRKVWKSFDKIDRSEKSWFMLESSVYNRKRMPNWNVKNEIIHTIFSEDDDEFFSSRWAGMKKDTETLRRLQRGGILPDGSHISWASGKFFLDGEIINLPYRDLREILGKSTHDMYDLKLILYLISLATENKPIDNKKNIFLRFQQTGMWNYNKNICKHPINNLEISEKKRFYETIKDITPKKLQQDTSYWMNGWDRELSDKTRIYPRRYSIPISLIIDRGRLMLRVRRNDKWRKIRVPRNLEIWSILINWCLTLPGNENRNHLESLQYYLFCNDEMEIIPMAEKNGIRFLKGIIENSNDKAYIDGKKIVVEGKYGVKYSVVPGFGPHGSRFKVLTDIVTDSDRIQEDMMRRLNRRLPGFGGPNHRRKELCIVEEPHLRKLVIGDAIGSIVMALLNDDKSRQKIDTLDKHLSQFGRQDEGNNQDEIDRRNREEIDRILQTIEYEEMQIARIQERIPGDFNERRLVQLRNQLEVLQDRLRYLQRAFGDMGRA